MTTTCRWDNPEKTIIYQKFEGTWEIDDLINGFTEISAMLDSVSYPVNIIVDMTEGKMPTGFLSRFNDIKETSYTDHPNADCFYMIDTSKFAEMMTKAFVQFSKMGDRIFIVGTVDEAYDMIFGG